MNDNITQFVSCAGWAAKVGLEDLKQITSNLIQPKYENLLVDFNNSDDCGIYKIDSRNIIVQSLDFITPIVDDLYVYGQIAAANSLSDVFAKGSVAHTAMSILMWDNKHIDVIGANKILQGALSKLIESNCVLIGGHSIVDIEQKFGLSVTGIINDGIFWRNNAAKVGDELILTKPIGTGILSSALKSNNLVFSAELDVVKSMLSLNLSAMLEAKSFNISACTDVSGFGLIGHAKEMINNDISINLYTDNILLFDRVVEFAKQNFIPRGSYRNKEALQNNVSKMMQKDDIYYYDAQTSGGLLIAVNKEDSKILLSNLINRGISASIIGECIKKDRYDIYLY